MLPCYRPGFLRLRHRLGATYRLSTIDCLVCEPQNPNSALENRTTTPYYLVTLADTKRLQWRYCHEDGNEGGYGLGAGNSAMVHGHGDDVW